MHTTKQKEPNLIGTVCVCSIGRVGVVYGRRQLPWGMSWVGFGLDGQGPWASQSPIKIAETLEEYSERVMSKPSQVMYPAVAMHHQFRVAQQLVGNACSQRPMPPMLKLRPYSDPVAVGWQAWIEDANGKAVGYVHNDGTLKWASEFVNEVLPEAGK